MSVWHISINI